MPRADYWKSLPRKFCTFCKCWITDNKPSIEFHEKGKKHQENVQIKIAAIRKKGQKDYEEKKSYENDMKKIEKAALKAFKKDLESNPELINQISPHTQLLAESLPAAKPKPKPKTERQQKPAESKQETQVSDIDSEKEKASSSVESPKSSTAKVWYEAVSDEGYTYYWNVETGESKWECQEGEYLSIQEQKDEPAKSDDNLKKEAPTVAEDNKEDDNSLDEEKDEVQISDVIGPRPRNDPYGQWTTVETSKSINLQLPKQENYTEIKIPVVKETNVKFKERTVATLQGRYASEEEVEFKKRKFISGKKRNIRRRESDD